jgi:hypothetical protein
MEPDEKDADDSAVFEEIERKRRRLAQDFRPTFREPAPRPAAARVQVADQGDLTGHLGGLLADGDVYLAKLRRAGPFMCRKCRSNKLDLPGICDPCAAQERIDQGKRALEHALRTLPEAWRWANFRDGSLFRKLTDHEAILGSGTMLRRLLAGEIWLIVLAGESGEGKTSLAAAMMRLCAEKHTDRMLLFVYAPKIARAYRNTPLGRTPALIDECDRAWLLVIDDLGADAVYRDSLREVIQCREAVRKPTIITTYLTEEEARDAYGGGISRRMYRDGGIIWMGGIPKGPVQALEGPEKGSITSGRGQDASDPKKGSREGFR